VSSRTARLSRRVRDAGALFAFLAVALSGSLPIWVTAATVLAFGLSFFGVRPFAKSDRVSAVVLIVIAIVLFGSAWTGALDLVVAACSFAALIASHRMLSDETLRTNLQVHLASLLMIAGGAAISGELWYAPCLFGFTAATAISMALDVIDEASFGAELPIRRALRPLSLGLVFAVIGGTAFFVLFPRLSWNVAGRRMPDGLGGVTGMSDTVKLGSGGSIKSSPRVVARIRVEPEPSGDNLAGYFVGRNFDTFDGQEWKGTGAPRSPTARINLDRGGERMVLQTIELLPAYESRTLIGLETPVFFSQARAFTRSGSNRTQLVDVPGEEVRFNEEANGYEYLVHSQPDPARRRPPVLDDVLRYTRLPDGLDPRIAALAQKIAGNEKDAQAAAAKVADYLQSNYTYTLDQGAPSKDPLADFLFVRKAGHCEHYATAHAVLMRSLGFASRVSAGFYGGERLGDAFVLRAGDAHAWTQVWSPGRGWVTWDATPPEGRTSQPAALLAAVVDLYERIDTWWRARVVDYSLRDQFLIARSLVAQPTITRSEGSSDAAAGPPPLAYLVAALVFGAVLFLFRRRSPRGKRHAAAGFLDAIEARLLQARVPRYPGEELEELSARLTLTHHPLAAPLSSAKRRYLEARFGDRPLEPKERAALLNALNPPAEPAPLDP
jgi:protein-glutamine gamma-glutamyltransferase